MKKTAVIFLCFIVSACQSETIPVNSNASIAFGSSTPLTAKCEAQLAVTEARSILAQNPILTASIDEEGDTSVNFRFDGMEFFRSGLNRNLTLANCSHATMVQLVRDISRLNVGRIARNGHLARAHRLSVDANNFERQMQTMLNDGRIEEVRADRLKRSILNLRKQSDRSVQRASGLAVVNFETMPNYLELEHALTTSLSNIQEYEADVELSRAVRVNLTGGVRYSQDDNTRVNVDDNEVEQFGSVSLSFRLGVLDPRFNSYKIARHEAEFEELYAENTGFLWQIQELHRKNLASEKMLLRERELLLKEISVANKGLKQATKPDRILAGKISKTLSEAELLRIDINLRDLRKMLNKLAGSQPSSTSGKKP